MTRPRHIVPPLPSLPDALAGGQRPRPVAPLCPCEGVGRRGGAKRIGTPAIRPP